MIELGPEVAPPAPPRRRPHRLAVAGVTLLAVVAGGLAVATGGDGPEAEPLALMATGGRGDVGAEQMSAPAPAVGFGSADSGARSSSPYYGGWGLTFKVEGDLPELAGKAAAWKASGPALDRAAVARIAGALGLAGSPVERDGGWWVDAGDWTLSAFPGEMWSVNLFRGRFGGRADDAAAGDAGDNVGPALSRPEAEARVRDLLERMGAPEGTWKVEITDTDIGTGWACASPAPALTEEELKRLEAEKLRQAPDVMSCPPPPAPVEGFNVALFPLLDGRRADWPVWNVTMRSDGRVENLYGAWTGFERAGDHKLRGVSAALEELRNPPVPEPFVSGGAVSDPDTPVAPSIAIDGGPAVDLPAQTGGGSTGSAGSAAAGEGRLPKPSEGTSTPAIAPAPPMCGPAVMPMPADSAMPADKARELDQAPASDAASSYAADCPTPEPQVVTITGVELALIQAPVWDDGRSRLYLVPAYRFTGRFQDGTAWETSVIALHRDAIAPPPDLPVRDIGRPGQVPAIGKAEPGPAAR